MENAYRLQLPVTVVRQGGSGHRLMQLPAGSVFYAETADLRREPMITATCKGHVVLMFSRDLEECARQITTRLSLVTNINR